MTIEIVGTSVVVNGVVVRDCVTVDEAVSLVVKLVSNDDDGC